METVINLNSEVYYKGTYWNDFPLVLEYMSKNFTGDGKKWWVEDFKERYAKKPFRHGLFINCGNGWLEREFIDKNIVKNITAFDISPDLIEEAENKKEGRKIKYMVADVNKITFNDNVFDLVINNAGLHHVQLIERFCIVLAKALEKDGMIVNCDYIGPHRNQYPIFQWVLAKILNSFLPLNVKHKLRYPNIATMLATDPTEAIHSELIVSSIKKYFNIIEKNDSGGGIAYLLLTHNSKLNVLSPNELNLNIERILRWDKLFSDLNVVPQLFSYFIAKPYKGLLQDEEKLQRQLNLEIDREKKAKKLGGVYSFFDYIKLIGLTYSNQMKAKSVKKLIWRFIPVNNKFNLKASDQVRELKGNFENKSYSPEDLVKWAYRLFLDREPENTAVVQEQISRFNGTSQLRKVFMKSEEFRAKNKDLVGTPNNTSIGRPPLPIERIDDPKTLEEFFHNVQHTWRALGESEPHWSVLSDDQFKQSALSENLKQFNQSGLDEVETLKQVLSRNGLKIPENGDCLEYGCGVGRVTRWLATVFRKVLAYDVSESHLRLAQNYMKEEKVENVSFNCVTDISILKSLPSIDFFYTMIVLQHNPPPIMEVALSSLLNSLKPMGIGVFQIPTYCAGYTFRIRDYLETISTPQSSKQMEMHVMPQFSVFKLISEAGCVPVEVFKDDWAGPGYESHTFVTVRPPS